MGLVTRGEEDCVTIPKNVSVGGYVHVRHPHAEFKQWDHKDTNDFENLSILSKG